MSEYIQLRYRYSQDTCLDAEHLGHRAQMRPVFRFLLGAYGLFLVGGSLWQLWADGISFAPFGRIIIGSLVLLGLWTLKKRIAASRLATMPEAGMWVLIKLSNDEILHSLESQDLITLPWSSIKKGLVGESGIILMSPGYGHIWLPYDAIENEDDKDRLLGLVRANVRKLRQVA